MTYELNRKQFTKALKKAKKRGQCKMFAVRDSLDLAEVGEPKTEVSAPTQSLFKLKSLRKDSIPDDILFPEELNQHLRKQIQELTAENGRLHRELSEKDVDLQTCVTQNEQLLSATPPPLIGLGRASELAASKIVELSKRVRELTAENEGAKARWRRAETKLRTLEDGTDVGQSKERRPGPGHEEGTEPNENEMKILMEKLSATMSKLCETRNQNQQLKQELKMANKALASEVGDVSVQSITSAGSTWRGRAQQILTLQQKVSNLQDKLKELGGEERPTVKNSGTSAVRQIERERQAAQEQMVNELQEKTQQLEDMKRKFEATRARCRVLENEQDKRKKAIEHFMEMDEHNKELIKTMSTELEGSEIRRAEKLKQENRKTNQWEERFKAANEVYMREKSKNEQLEMIIRQKEEQLQQLKAVEEANYEECANIRQPNSHLGSRQHSMSSNSTPDQGENQTLLLAAEAERIRLLELAAVLNHRLDEQRNQSAEALDNLRRERAKTARLETKVGRLEMEKHGMSRSNSYAGSRSSSDNNAIKEGVRYKIELMEEEILALKSRLGCLQQEKEEDLKIYKNAFEEVQKVFLEGSLGKNGSPISRSIFGSL